MSRWVLVADASASAGLGHVARSSALAGALRELGAEVEAHGLGASSAMTVDDVEWAPLDDLEGVEAGALVLDSYTVAPGVPARIARRGKLAMFLDGGEAAPGTALAVDVGAAGEPDERHLVGLRFACLRRMFRERPPATVRDAAESVLVATGGGDATAGGPGLARAAAQALPDARVRLLRGPYASGDVPPEVEAVAATPETAGLLAEHDIVITAGGQTLLEAAACGVPAVVVPSADNQLGNAARVEEAGAAQVLPSSAEGLAEALRSLAPDAERRREMATAGQAAVDGLGARRVAERLVAL